MVMQNCGLSKKRKEQNRRYLNLDFRTPKARSTTILVLEWASLNATSSGRTGLAFGVIRHFLSGYPESPTSQPQSLSSRKVFKPHLSNIPASCWEPGHLATTSVNLKCKWISQTRKSRYFPYIRKTCPCNV